jgi:hypothetical protein
MAYDPKPTPPASTGTSSIGTRTYSGTEAYDPNPAPPASTGTWQESIETRLSFVESVVRAGHAVGQQPGSGPTIPVTTETIGTAKDAALNPAPPPPKQPAPPEKK